MPKIFFEWVLIPSRGDEIYLSEKQYEFYKQNQNGGKIFFNEIEVNPPFVVQAFKRPSEVLKRKYPCKECHTTGQIKNEDCEQCEGMGVQIPK